MKGNKATACTTKVKNTMYSKKTKVTSVKK